MYSRLFASIRGSKICPLLLLQMAKVLQDAKQPGVYCMQGWVLLATVLRKKRNMR